MGFNGFEFLSFSSTGFLATWKDEGVKKVCFLSAGHNFLRAGVRAGQPVWNEPFWNAKDENEVFSELNNHVIHFANLDGIFWPPSMSLHPPEKGKPMSLGEFLRKYQFYGSISCQGRRKVFKKVENGWQVLNQITNEDKDEDYCAFCLDDSNFRPEQKLAALGLKMLECGENDYLDNKPENLATIVGHPAGNCEKEAEDGTLRTPLRFSFGQEKKFKEEVKESDEYKRLSKYRLFFDYDSIGGNSGSPVIGRGNKFPSGGVGEGYKVKGIHVEGEPDKRNTFAQKITKLGEWINHGK